MQSTLSHQASNTPTRWACLHAHSEIDIESGRRTYTLKHTSIVNTSVMSYSYTLIDIQSSSESSRGAFLGKSLIRKMQETASRRARGIICRSSSSHDTFILAGLEHLRRDRCTLQVDNGLVILCLISVAPPKTTYPCTFPSRAR